MQVGDGRIQVSSGVVKVFQGAKTLQERLFGRKMQDLQRRSEKVRFFLQIKPKQTVSLQRQTFGTQSIIHGEKPAEFDPRKYLGPARDNMKKLYEHKIINVLGSNDKLEQA